MRRVQYFFISCLFFLIPALLPAANPKPDVTKKHSTKVEFKGSLGTMMKLFGGNKPIYQVEYLKGNIKRIDTVDKKGKIKESQIIDLDREVFIKIDYKKKKYTEMTFEQWKEMMKSGLASILQQPQENRPESDQPGDEKPEVKLKFDVNVDRPGDKKKFAGYETEKVVLTLKAEADVEATDKDTGEKMQGRGGMIVRSTNWVTKALEHTPEEIEFNKRFVEKLGMAPDQGGLAGFMSTIMEKNPDLAAALEKLKEAGEDLEGVALRSESVFETWGESDQKMKDTDDKQEQPKSVGGLLKGFGKKFGKKKKDKDEPNVLLESYTDVSFYSRDAISSEVFVVPAKFKKEEVKLPKKE